MNNPGASTSFPARGRPTSKTRVLTGQQARNRAQIPSRRRSRSATGLPTALMTTSDPGAVLWSALDAHVTRHIDLICVPQPMSAVWPQAAQNGGSACDFDITLGGVGGVRRFIRLAAPGQAGIGRSRRGARWQGRRWGEAWGLPLRERSCLRHHQIPKGDGDAPVDPHRPHWSLSGSRLASCSCRWVAPGLAVLRPALPGRRVDR